MAISDQDLLTMVRQETDDARTWMRSDLFSQQADALKLYTGEPFGNEVPGKSQIVTRDVAEAIEGIMPELMKIFTAGDSVVQFEPEGPEDIAGAEQATDYLNYIFNRRMQGFKILYDWFKDALLMKNGIVKIDWNDDVTENIADYEGLDATELDLLEADEHVKIIEKSEQENGLFNAKIKRTVQKGMPSIQGIPSEDFLIKRRSVSIEDADFVGFKSDRTVGDLIDDGFDPDEVMKIASIAQEEDSEVSDARFRNPEEGTASLLRTVNSGPGNRTVRVVEAYIRVFDDADDEIKLFKVITGQNSLLHREEVDMIPFVSLSPYMMPHKFYGTSITDLTQDIQVVNSTFFRQVLDNIYLQNSGRYAAVEGQVNLSDLLENRIGGIVRTKVQGAVQRLDTPDLSPQTFTMMDRLEQMKENRVGVSKMTQGLDPNALTSNTAATAVNQIMSAAQQKILLIARIFAETGVKELMWKLYRLVRTHQFTPEMVRLRGKFVEVAPFDWEDRYDMQVTVGIGNGNKDQQLFHLNNISQIMQQIGNTEYAYMVSPENVFNLSSEFIKNAGFKDVDSFITDPSKVSPPPPQPDPELVKAQAEAQKDQAEIQLKQQELQLKQAQLQLDQAKFEWQKKVEASELVTEVAQDRPVGIGKGGGGN